MESKALSQKIAEFEDVQIQIQMRDTIRRLRETFDRAVEMDDGLSSARALIEKVNLVCGNRRVQHIRIGFDRRVLSDE